MPYAIFRRKAKIPRSRMSKADEKAAREQRLATKLRDNLRRRKGQAKARVGATPKPSPAGPGDGTSS